MNEFAKVKAAKKEEGLAEMDICELLDKLKVAATNMCETRHAFNAAAARVDVLWDALEKRRGHEHKS